MSDLATTGTNCFPEPPEITVNEYTINLGDEDAHFVTDTYAPAAGTSSLTLTETPVSASSLALFKNRAILLLGTDYTRSGTAITLLTATMAGDIFQANYFTAG